jgi:hypothetical protein
VIRPGIKRLQPARHVLTRCDASIAVQRLDAQWLVERAAYDVQRFFNQPLLLFLGTR